eukprot:2948351-Amphidinium_carterae.2
MLSCTSTGRTKPSSQGMKMRRVVCGAQCIFVNLEERQQGQGGLGWFVGPGSIRILRFVINLDTVVSERIAIDCSCFSLHGHHFTA